MAPIKKQETEYSEQKAWVESWEMVKIETVNKNIYTMPKVGFGSYNLVQEQIKHGLRQVTFLNHEGAFLSVPVAVLKRIYLVRDTQETLLWEASE